jgi:hypothetical protein
VLVSPDDVSDVLPQAASDAVNAITIAVEITFLNFFIINPSTF